MAALYSAIMDPDLHTPVLLIFHTGYVFVSLKKRKEKEKQCIKQVYPMPFHFFTIGSLILQIKSIKKLNIVFFFDFAFLDLRKNVFLSNQGSRQ